MKTIASFECLLRIKLKILDFSQNQISAVPYKKSPKNSFCGLFEREHLKKKDNRFFNLRQVRWVSQLWKSIPGLRVFHERGLRNMSWLWTVQPSHIQKTGEELTYDQACFSFERENGKIQGGRV